MRVSPKLGDNGTMLPRLLCTKHVSFSQMLWGLFYELIGNRDGTIKVRNMLGTLAMFERQLEHRLVPDLFKGLKVSVIKSFNAQCEGFRVLRISFRASGPYRSGKLVKKDDESQPTQ